jgi:hypothetical protein
VNYHWPGTGRISGVVHARERRQGPELAVGHSLFKREVPCLGRAKELVRAP